VCRETAALLFLPRFLLTASASHIVRCSRLATRQRAILARMSVRRRTQLEAATLSWRLVFLAVRAAFALRIAHDRVGVCPRD